MAGVGVDREDQGRAQEVEEAWAVAGLVVDGGGGGGGGAGGG